MNLSQIIYLIQQGHSNKAIFEQVPADVSSSPTLGPKHIGFIRRLMENGESEEAMLLVSQTLDGSGNVVSEKYARRNLHNPPVPEGAKEYMRTTNPNGSDWIRYRPEYETSKELKKELIAKVRPLNITYTNEIRGNLALEINVTDHHFGKIPFG